MSNFNAALPPPYSANWKQAERSSPEDSPRLTSYEAPGGEPIQFILKNFEFSGGQSVDTAEYPFGGLWSNEALNEKPQELHIEGFIRGAEYIQTRNALIEALRIKTDDSSPGYIDFPFWGRFPIVVVDYKIAENTDEKGQCSVTLVFKRAGVSIADRAGSLSGMNTAGMSIVAQESSPSSMSIAAAPVAGQANSFSGMDALGGGAERASSLSGMGDALETAIEELETAAIESFEQALFDNTDASVTNMLSQGFTQIKSELSSSLGRIQAAQATLNTISATINGLFNVVAQIVQIVRAPGQLARALFDAAASITTGVAEIKNSPPSYQSASGSASKTSYQTAASIIAGSSGISNNAALYMPAAGSFSKSSYPAPANNNERNVLLQFLSASTFTLSTIPLTVRQEAAQKAIENLYRVSAFIASSALLARLDVSFQKTLGYWKLFQKLEASIDKSDPAVYAALETVRIYVSRILSAKELSAERKRLFNAQMPLLSLSQYIGCGEEKLRELNHIADSFVIKGSVLYV